MAIWSAFVDSREGQIALLTRNYMEISVAYAIWLASPERTAEIIGQAFQAGIVYALKQPPPDPKQMRKEILERFTVPKPTTPEIQP